MGQGWAQVREKATGDLLFFVFVKNPLKQKFFDHFLCRFVLTCAVLEKDPIGSKVLEICDFSINFRNKGWKRTTSS